MLCYRYTEMNFVVDAVDKFIAAEGLERTTKMLSQSSGKPHVVFNLVSLYTAVCQTGES